MPDVDRDALRTAAENATLGLDDLVIAIVEENDPRLGDPSSWYHEHERRFARCRPIAEARSVLRSKAFRDWLDAHVADALAAAEARADRAEGAIRNAVAHRDHDIACPSIRGVSCSCWRSFFDAAYHEQTGRAPEWSDPEPWRCGMHPGERFQLGDRDSGNCSWIRSPRTREQYEKEQNA